MRSSVGFWSEIVLLGQLIKRRVPLAEGQSQQTSRAIVLKSISGNADSWDSEGYLLRSCLRSKLYNHSLDFLGIICYIVSPGVHRAQERGPQALKEQGEEA